MLPFILVLPLGGWVSCVTSTLTPHNPLPLLLMLADPASERTPGDPAFARSLAKVPEDRSLHSSCGPPVLKAGALAGPHMRPVFSIALSTGGSFISCCQCQSSFCLLLSLLVPALCLQAQPEPSGLPRPLTKKAAGAATLARAET